MSERVKPKGTHPWRKYTKAAVQKSEVATERDRQRQKERQATKKLQRRQR